MVINENNSLINAFAKGMNSDTAYDMVDNQQYVFGKNVRITKNEFLGGDLSATNHSSLHEGAITPVPAGKNKLVNTTEKGSFLCSDSIGNIFVVVRYDKESNRLLVYRYTIDEKTDAISGGLFWAGLVVREEDQNRFEELTNNEKSVSTVLYQELEDVIKLYIATGIYPIIEIRVDGDLYRYISRDDAAGLNIDGFIHNRILPKYPIYILGKIDGSLKTQQVQYTYRYYNKFGTATLLAPLTNKIQVISPNRSTEVGNAQDTATSIGFQLKIRCEGESSIYDRLLIYRLSYIVPGEDAKVSLIYDGDIKIENNNNFLYNDVGNVALLELTMEEFAAMSGMVIIPKVIEQNQLYMFASNVIDDTIIENVEIDNSGAPTAYDGITVPITTQTSTEPVLSSNSFNTTALNYFKDRNINPTLPKQSYSDIFTSSLLRSLRRGETYKYGIVYYDKYGRHTNVLKLGDINVPEISSNQMTQKDGAVISAKPIGVRINIPTPKTRDLLVINDIVGCLIVRRSSKQIYQKTLLLVAISKTIAQDLYDTELTAEQKDKLNHGRSWGNVEKPTPKMSPNYPTGFLLSDKVTTVHGYYLENCVCPAYTRNDTLYMAMSNEFDFRRDDVMSSLQSNILKINKVANYTLSSNDAISYNSRKNGVNIKFARNVNTIEIDNHEMKQESGNKISEHILFPLYYYNASSSNLLEIKSVKDTKVAQWYDGFSNVEISGGDIQPGAIKKYQSFNTNIDNYTYNNWVSSGIYDLRISSYDDEQANLTNDGNEILKKGKTVFISRTEWHKDDFANGVNALGTILTSWNAAHQLYTGFIGPGPSCFLFTLKNGDLGGNGFGAALCNIQHEAIQDNAEPDEVVQYFGFGNYFPLKWDESNSRYIVDRCTSVKNNTVQVYDGDIYITPHELVTMYKTYDFISADTLPSMQVVNYVPMESKVNTFFDYGMNYLNTNSTNLLSEPGSIDGVTTQERPIHQYNQIYSANDESNDVFTLVVEKPQDNRFKQRTYYSEPKTNGEYVDNFVVFKPAAYIDVDPNYGEITNLFTDKNTLYYWQDTAFGKFSVNERSLINDLNGNTIMLGQAGILSRNDYISTKYGMRLYDFCATAAENGVYWVDVNNKAIVGAAGNEAVNIGERLNVLNIINSKIDTYIPKVHYDLLNNELLCQCLSEDSTKWLLIFNLKLNVATSMYNRNYIDIASIKNHMYGYNTSENGVLFTKYNYLGSTNLFLKPLAVSLIVNPSASTTKVFDSQQLVPAKRIEWDGREILPKGNDLSDRLQFKNPGFWTTFFENINASFSFETDINNTDNPIEAYTDREGNIIYNIPRYGKFDSVDENLQPIKINYNPRTQWGNRLRGKWMRVNFTAENPNEYTTISHVITKFRQSYS